MEICKTNGMKHDKLTKEQWERIQPLLPLEEQKRKDTPVEFLLSVENDHDCIQAVGLLEKIEINERNMLADCAYGAQTI